MRRSTLAALAVAIGTGCVYTDPINQRPVVSRVLSEAELTRWDEPVTVDIEAYDPDGDTMTVGYTLTEMPDGLSMAGESRTFTFMPSGPGEYRIVATATDSYGASGSLDARLTVPNQTPSILDITTLADPDNLEGDGRYQLLTALQFQVERSAYDDDDPFDASTWSWRFVSRPASSALDAPTGCGDHGACFTADAPGHYQLEVSVTDPHGATGRARTSVDVDIDRPPCIAGTLPAATTSLLVVDVGSPVALAVTSVADDLDPWPAGPQGAATFHWQIKRASDSAFVPIDLVEPQLSLDAAGVPGERVEVRVGVADRVTRTLDCPADQRECDFQTGCPGWLTWEIEYR
jgi:hypothetical protein